MSLFKKAIPLAILCLFLLSACAIRADQAPTGAAEALDMILPFFEEPDNRVFETTFPAKVENEECYQISVSGILSGGATYPIDTFAVNPHTNSLFFYDHKAEQFIPLLGVPTFACKTSPDGRLRIESVGMNRDADGSGGLHNLLTMRIIGLSDGGVMWSDTGFLSNEFYWSEDSRFVAANYSGRLWTETIIIEAGRFSVITPPGTGEILEVSPEYAPLPGEDIYVRSLRALGWESPASVRIGFEWSVSGDVFVRGEYAYDVMSRKLDILEIGEISAG